MQNIKMEYHRKHAQNRPQDKKAKERQKNQFFAQVFKECQSQFSSKQFQFFVKCIIPHRSNNNRLSSQFRKSRNSTTNQKQTNINEINPNIFTIPRRLNFYQQKTIENIKLEKVNRRLLTTPTQKAKNQIGFTSYQEFQVYKKMKKYQEDMNSKLKTNNSHIKMYSPQPLFYPPSQNKEIPKIRLNIKTSKSHNKHKKRDLFRQQYLNSTNQKLNSQLLPQNFVQLLKSPKTISTYRYARTGCPKTGYPRSMR